MAKSDNPWWGKNDTLWGGETFASSEDASRIGVITGDKFRIEKGPKNITLIPHPLNNGTWNKSHSKSKPIKLTEFKSKKHKRGFSMLVKIKPGSAPMELFLFERKNHSIAITDDKSDPGAHGGTASVER